MAPKQTIHLYLIELVQVLYQNTQSQVKIFQITNFFDQGRLTLPVSINIQMSKMSSQNVQPLILIEAPVKHQYFKVTRRSLRYDHLREQNFMIRL